MKAHPRHRPGPDAISATSAEAAQPAVEHHAWRFEYDSKVFCEHCRNYRGPQHTAEHHRIVAEGGSWRKRRIATNYWP